MENLKLSRKITTTNDGSNTIYIAELDEHYHSTHGALQEALHVFIETGLRHVSQSKSMVRILEIGFGTGFNALLTALNTEIPVHYTGLEAYPVSNKMVEELNYSAILGSDEAANVMAKVNIAAWEQDVVISDSFTLKKVENKLGDIQFDSQFDLVYFDAFGPRAQPDMWHPDHFEKILNAMTPGAVLVTYCAKGQVRRDLQAVGFSVERLPGPPGKREMLRATKNG